MANRSDIWKKGHAKSKLYQTLSDNVLESVGKATDESDAPVDIKSYLQDILPVSSAHQIDKDLSNCISITKIRRKSLQNAKLKARKVGLSQLERRKLGLYDLPKNSITYEQAKAMNRLWKSYMSKNLNLSYLNTKRFKDDSISYVSDTLTSSLLKADYHGAFVKIINSKCPTLVGQTGIIVFDTKYTFKMVGTDNITRTIPKEPCIFEIILNNYKFKIFGKYFCIRSSERPTKKIKSSFIPVL